MSLRHRSVALLFALAACSGLRADDAADPVGPLTKSLAANGALTAPWMPRFSIATTTPGCGTIDSLPEIRCRATNAVVDERLVEVAGEVARKRAGTPDADVLQAAALVDLVGGDTVGNSIERSISYLEMATRLQPTSSRFTDLAAARLVHASQRGGSRALVEALDAAGHAIELRPRNSAARYNRALALDLLGLDAQAALAWRDYLAVDSTSAFAPLVRTQLRKTSTHERPALPASTSGVEALGAFAHAAPLAAQSFAWDTLFREWGASVESGDTATARLRLSALETIGAILSRDRRDQSVEDAVRAIDDARADRRITRTLANLHSRFAVAQDRTKRAEHVAADSSYREIIRLRPPSRALRERAMLAHAGALVYQQKPDSADIDLGRFLARRDPSNTPLLDGRAHFNRGIMLLRRQHQDDGLREVETARTFFEKAGDVESAAAAVGVGGEIMFQLGDAEDGYRITHRALVSLRDVPASQWRHNVLYVMSRAAARSGLSYAARDIEDEDANAAGQGTRLTSVVEVSLARARSAWLRGRADEASAATQIALAAIPRLPDAATRTQLLREVDLTVGTGLVQSHPDSAIALLSAAIDFYTPLNYPTKLIPAQVARSSAYLAVGRIDLAERDLDVATRAYDQARNALRSAALQHAIAEQVRGVFDTLVMVHVRAGHQALALAALERGRVAFTSRSVTKFAAAAVPRHDRIVVDYALIGDHLLIWTVAAAETTMVATKVPHADLVVRIERVRSAMELGTSEQALRADLAALYDVLLRPIEARLSGDRIAIVTDGAISQVPFAALWDSRTNAYLVRRYATSLAPTLSIAMAGGTSSPPVGATTIVADPALDRHVFATLSPLPQSAAEGRDLSVIYPHAHTILGAEVDSAAVAESIQRSEVLHYAGHALFNDAQPWQSTLALRPRGLSASAIASLDLHDLRLAVLSACETMRAPDQRVGGFAGLTDAFLAAGAGGVIGSLWQVDDALTRTLMRDFHQRYAKSGDAPLALRQAQLALMAVEPSPSAWAAFRYAGH